MTTFSRPCHGPKTVQQCLLGCAGCVVYGARPREHNKGLCRGEWWSFAPLLLVRLGLAHLRVGTMSYSHVLSAGGPPGPAEHCCQRFFPWKWQQGPSGARAMAPFARGRPGAPAGGHAPWPRPRRCSLAGHTKLRPGHVNSIARKRFCNSLSTAPITAPQAPAGPDT